MRLAKLALVLMAAGVAAMAQPAAPRQSPEFAISFPDGSQSLLSKHRGKVIVMEFLFTTCPHCQETSRKMQKLYTEYGPKGLQPIGIAFNDMPKLHVPDFVRFLGLTFPVGYQSREAVMSYLGLKPEEMVHVPQVVFIDRKGVIRQQSIPRGDNKTHSETNMRAMIETLLKEPGGPVKKSAAKKNAS